MAKKTNKNTVNTETTNNKEKKNMTKEIAHVELTGKIINAYVYRNLKKSDKGRDVFGIMFSVKLTESNNGSFFGTTRRINYFMNNTPERINNFEELIQGIYEEKGELVPNAISLSEKVKVNDFIGYGIRAYVRKVDWNAPGGVEYTVNENYEIEKLEEPIYMEEIPFVPDANDFHKNSTSSARNPKSRQPKVSAED